MALELNTDIAVELNITSRKNDSFQMKLAVVDSANSNLPYNLSGTQTGAPADYFNGLVTMYQGKMTIKKENSKFESLNVYSYYWKDSPISNLIPTIIKSGHWSGYKTGVIAAGNSNEANAGIWFKNSLGVEGDTISISIPAEYMNLDPGVYVYDLQSRRKLTYDSANTELGTSYTTWLYGTFTVVDDVTKQ